MSYAPHYTTVPTIKWPDVFRQQARASGVNFIPRFAGDLQLLPYITGDDESDATVGIIIRGLAVLVETLTGHNIPSPVFALRTEHSLIIIRLLNRETSISVYQLSTALPPRAGTAAAAVQPSLPIPPPVAKRWHLRHDYGNVTFDVATRTTPHAPDNWTASVQLTADLANDMALLEINYQYSAEEIVDDIDEVVDNAFVATVKRSVTLAQLLERRAFDMPEVASSSELPRRIAVRKVMDLTDVVVRVGAGGGATAAVNRATALKQQLPLLAPMVASNLAIAVCETFFDAPVARLRILRTEDWPREYAIYPLDAQSLIEVDESGGNETTIAEFLRRVRQALAVVGVHLPPTAYPFAMLCDVDRQRARTPAALLEQPNYESKRGVILVDNTGISLAQLGVFDGDPDVQSRRTTLDTTQDRVTFYTSSMSNFVAPRDSQDVNVAGGPVRVSQISVLGNADITPLVAKRGGALGPFIDLVLSGIYDESEQSYTAVHAAGLLALAHSIADARSDELPVLMNLYNNFEEYLRIILRDVAIDIFGARPNIFDEQPQQTASTERRGAKRLSKETTTLSRINGNRGKKRTEKEVSEEEEKAKRTRNVNDDDDDDETENIEAPDQPTATLADISEVIQNEECVKTIFDYVGHNFPVSLTALQIVSRAFARHTQLQHPMVYAEIWRRKYPVLAYEFGFKLPSFMSGRDPVVAGLIAAIINKIQIIDARQDQIDAEIELLKTRVPDISTPEGRAVDMTANFMRVANYRAALDARRAIYADLVVERGRATALYDSLVGRAIYRHGEATIREFQRYNFEENRNWTLLLSVVDNIAHHPRVIRALLEEPFQNAQALWRKTLDAENVLARTGLRLLTLKDGLRTLITPAADDSRAQAQRPNQPGRDSALAGRYYVAKRREESVAANPIIELSNQIELFEDVANATHAQVLLSYLSGVEVGHEEEVYYAETEFNDMPDPITGIDHHQRQMLAVGNFYGSRHYMEPKQRVVALREMTNLNVESLIMVAIDHALLTGLRKLVGSLAVFGIEGWEPVTEFVRDSYRETAQEWVDEMIMNGEIAVEEDEDFDEIRDEEIEAQISELFDNDNPIRQLELLARGFSRELRSDERQLVAATGQQLTLAEEILRQLDLLAEQKFGTLAQFTTLVLTSAAGNRRQFSRLDYHFLIYLFNVVVINYTAQRNGLLVYRLLTLSEIESEEMFVEPIFRRRLANLRANIRAEVGATLAGPFTALTNTVERRRQLAHQLAAVGIRAADFFQVETE